MKEFFTIIKEQFILLLGIGLFTYGLFSFNSGYYLGHSGLMLDLTVIRSYPITTYYYYNHTSLLLLAIGAIFIVIGLLKRREQ